MPYSLPPAIEDIAELGDRALAAIPAKLREQVRGVSIIVEDAADDETVAELGLENAWELTGVYRGIPFGRAESAVPHAPDMIVLYREPILLEWIETGEDLVRHDEPSPTRAAVLVRLSHSHIRIGTFQRFAALEEPENILRLLDHTIRTHMPHLWHDDVPTRTAAFLAEVAGNVAVLGASWMAAGFVHGVLNTDNINVTGESFDYGPWRWLPHYDPEFTAAYFDHGGLYAYGRQPDTLLWNLVRLAECLLPLADKTALQAAIETFPPAFHAALDAAVLRRLGLATATPAQDHALATAWWAWLSATKTPFEQAFFDVRAGRRPRTEAFAPVQDLLDAYKAPEASDAYFVAAHPCTLLIDEVEALWAPIAANDDWSLFQAKLAHIEAMRLAYA